VSTITKALLTQLKAHYRKPGSTQDGEILVTEVTAPASNRSCDLLRVGMWPSRGLAIDVHELKVSRADWLRELDDPGKADAWWRFCSRFWVVAMPGVVNRSELPAGWGLMLPPNRANGRRFRVVVPAESREPEVSLPLLVEILRRADNTRLNEIDDLVMKHREQVQKARVDERSRLELDTLSPDVRERLALLDKLEQAVGMRLERFAWGTRGPVEEATPEELAAALGDFPRGHVALQRRETDLARLETRLRRGLEQALDELGLATAKRGDAA